MLGNFPHDEIQSMCYKLAGLLARPLAIIRSQQPISCIDIMRYDAIPLFENLSQQQDSTNHKTLPEEEKYFIGSYAASHYAALLACKAHF